MKLRVTRRVAFHARHRMTKPGWSEAEAERRFGWTSAAPGHGHLYRVAVSVTGVPDAETGTIIDLAALDAILAREVTSRYGGSDLNASVRDVVDGRVVPSCEALAAAIWRDVTHALPDGVILERVVVAEDDTLEAECRGVP
jgi:6-pyruvoyltetrahydropterin/6-carboxytetrahydropterin synthase